MFIVTAKLRPRRILLGAVAVVLVIGSIITLSGLVDMRRAQETSARSNPKGVKTNEDRIAFLESYGWEVTSEPIAVEELLIPDEFNETYDEYLTLQSAQGFDLTAYTGKRVKRYAYEIINYPSGETGVQAGLLIYKNTVIGGEVLSSKLDGFIHGLEMPK